MQKAGDRSVSYDLEVVDEVYRRAYLRAVGLESGKYEVKSLWRKNENQVFDRRFKVGQRGELIYGRRDAQVKAFGTALEGYIDDLIEHSLPPTKSGGHFSPHPPATPGSVTPAVTELHDIIDRIMVRKHSKTLLERLGRLAKASLEIPRLTVAARNFLSGGIQAVDIERGFSDIQGIFIVAGPIYTLVSQTEYSKFLAFDSASSEGPKLRYLGVIPSNKQHGRNKGNK